MCVNKRRRRRESKPANIITGDDDEKYDFRTTLALRGTSAEREHVVRMLTVIIDTHDVHVVVL